MSVSPVTQLLLLLYHIKKYVYDYLKNQSNKKVQP